MHKFREREKGKEQEEDVLCEITLLETDLPEILRMG